MQPQRTTAGRPTLEQRFWAKVDQGAPNGCWEWIASTRQGYGAFAIGKRHVLAHRFAYELLMGLVPEGLELDHLCRNTRCVNPAHLEAVTHQENMRRSRTPAAENARKTHCKRGHPFDAQNTYVLSRGERVCRTCARARAQEGR